VIALPPDVAARYSLTQGAEVNILDLNGVLVLSPKPSVVGAMAARIGRHAKEAGLTRSDMLRGLRRRRKEAAARRATGRAPAGLLRR